MIYDVEGNTFFFNPSLKYNAMTNMDATLGMMTVAHFNKRGKSSDFDTLVRRPLFFLTLKLYY